jgi:putative sporulation protein YtaF
MMHWFSVLFIAFASNLDNLAIGISLGIRKTKITSLSNVAIAVITMLGTYLSMTAGVFIINFISENAANYLGAAIISFIGTRTVVKSLRSPKTEKASLNVIRNSEYTDDDHHHFISLKESATLGIALALNNVATGLGAGATGISPFLTMIGAGLFSLFFIGFGSKFGLVIARSWFGKYAETISGLLLIIIGIYEVFA